MSDESPRPSATVVLLTESAAGLETFLVRRHGKAAFGGMWAFPGGVLEANDARVYAACDGLSEADANRLLSAPNGLMYYSAAIRELFEETGVMLASHSASHSDLSLHRDSLNAGALAWEDFVDETACRLDVGALHYMSFWTTPKGVGRRFATRFFAAALPEGQAAEHCGGELTDSAWHTPAAALELNQDGELPMIPATVRTIEFLAGHESLASVLEAADAIAEEGVVEILPKAVVRDGKRTILMPGDPGYAEAPS